MTTDAISSAASDWRFDLPAERQKWLGASANLAFAGLPGVVPAWTTRDQGAAPFGRIVCAGTRLARNCGARRPSLDAASGEQKMNIREEASIDIARYCKSLFAGPLLRSLAATAFVASTACAHAPAQTRLAALAPVIPIPRSVEVGEGAFVLERNATILAAGGGEADRIALYFADLMRRTADFDLKVAPANRAPAGAAIMFKLEDGALSPGGGYAIDVSPDGVSVKAASPQDLFYGAVTLWQLATPADGASRTIPAIRIADAPGLEWRGAMLDSARHYQPPEFIKSFIDWIALHKLNVLHWHLTDDQAWRIEIKKYPKLTEIGAFRVPAGEAGREADPTTGAPRRYGGYYTQEDIREIVAYAKDRFVTIVPEIDMPGHAQAAIVAYPELGAGRVKPRSVSSDWGIFPDVFNIDEITFEFLEDVLAETASLFPGPYIHVGGDEVSFDHWRESPAAKALIGKLRLADETKLQEYFTGRIAETLKKIDRRLVGWDEITEGELSESALVMSWRGVDGAIEAARRGHDVVLSPAPALYFDNRQGEGAEEPPGRGNLITLESAYRFDPYPDESPLEQRSHIKGVQANIWTEHIRTPERVEYMAFPRLAAVAEIAWVPEAEKDWPGFVARIAPMLARYERLGINYARTAFAPRVSIQIDESVRRISLSSQAGVGDIRYTLDGTAPHESARRYSGEFEVKPPATVRAATFIGGRKIAEASESIDGKSHFRRKSQELSTCDDKLVLNLEDDDPPNGERAVFLIDIMSPCWIFPQAALTGVSTIEARVGQVPFNFQIGDEVDEIELPSPRTAEGELEVRLGSCDGDLLASLPLARAAANPGVTMLQGPLAPRSGSHDLCLRFTGDHIEPMWALEEVRLVTNE